MKKQLVLIRSLALSMVMVLAIASQAYAQDSQFNRMVQDVQRQRTLVEVQLGIGQQFDTYPHATSYYDDKVDHYEYVLIMSDFIDKGIR